ncbi:MAG: preprotein translocase subunit Sec61beta [Candidatus Woesearchaeota archaeon]
MAEEKIRMPATQGGLVRYFEDYKSKIQFKPGHVILMAAIVVIIEIILHSRG